MIGNAHVSRDREMSGRTKIAETTPIETQTPRCQIIGIGREARIEIDSLSTKGGSGFSDSYAHEKPSAHTAQVRAVFEQLRAGRKAAFLSPLHRASARRREREMAKPMEWWSPSAVKYAGEEGGRKGIQLRIYDIPRGSRSADGRWSEKPR